jgi:hypothetical protein
LIRDVAFHSMVVLLHGTSAEHLRSIDREGLRPPQPRAGVYVTRNRTYALWAAQVACLRARQERGGDEILAEGLLVYVDASGMAARQTGVLDLFVPSWRVDRVERSRVVRMERVGVRLPGPGSADEVGMLRAGFGQRVSAARPAGRARSE